ncbi:hypothetical protein [Mesorhizobium sp.]|uniref:hypothetical protein n=1 Tax=Mesorhizobium sp. TaxID=1871066 RepID=UPI000FE4EC38|nr:hypothetical protein [Mesorhizobium sp.]RWP58624.1 MAG: hypothetical protein EOR08_26655 [Mesorhizobium sp.]
MPPRDRKDKNDESQPTLQEIIDRLGRRAECDILVGEALPDRNFDNHTIIVSDRDTYYSVHRDHILEAEPVGPARFRFFIRPRSAIWRASRTNPDGSQYLLAMEMFEPPKMLLLPGDPDAGTAQDQQKLSAGRTIEGAAKVFSGACTGGDVYPNNCAHFLSNAFIQAGFAGLGSSHSCINARCSTSARRPIRAREMRCWFEAMAITTGGAVQRNTGFWAVFQLDESAYWGGHAVIIDSDNWKYYGTGWYSAWDQHSFQW